MDNISYIWISEEHVNQECDSHGYHKKGKEGTESREPTLATGMGVTVSIFIARPKRENIMTTMYSIATENVEIFISTSIEY